MTDELGFIVPTTSNCPNEVRHCREQKPGFIGHEPTRRACLMAALGCATKTIATLQLTTVIPLVPSGSIKGTRRTHLRITASYQGRWALSSLRHAIS